MKCEVCHQRNADIVFKTVAGGHVATRAMCLVCAQKMQQDMIKMFMELGFTPDEKTEAPAPQEAQFTMPSFLCAQCGRPYDQLDENTMAGCASCYEALQTDLAVHFQKDEHTAMAIANANHNEAIEADAVSEIKYRLLEAVVKEDFEAAALLRDKIRQMTKDSESNT